MIPVYGAARLLTEIVALGYEAELAKAPNDQVFAVVAQYTIELGKYAGRRIGLGLQTTPDFPKTVASAIHVRAKPQIYELTDSVPNVRNIQPSALGEDWRYWSNNFNWSEERSARRLMSQVNRIFNDA
jgi:hypothetical protein